MKETVPQTVIWSTCIWGGEDGSYKVDELHGEINFVLMSDEVTLALILRTQALPLQTLALTLMLTLTLALTLTPRQFMPRMHMIQLVRSPWRAAQSTG